MVGISHSQLPMRANSCAFLKRNSLSLSAVSMRFLSVMSVEKPQTAYGLSPPFRSGNLMDIYVFTPSLPGMASSNSMGNPFSRTS